MRAAVLALVDELKRRRLSGEKDVYLDEATMRTLHEATGTSSQPPPAARSAANATPPRQHSGARRSKEAISEELANFQSHQNKPPAPATASTGSAPPQSRRAAQASEADSSIPPPPIVELPEGDRQTQWNWLRDRVLNCPECNRHLRPGKQVVFGVGSVEADVFFCGEAPGAEEESQGEPFVGPAGQLLTKVIGAMGLKRDEVYIGNILNWRPEHDRPSGNRPPTATEMAFCLPYLRAQLAIVQPKVIVALGNTAIEGLLGPGKPVGRVHGQWHSFEGTDVMPTYHPSYIIRQDNMKVRRTYWEDMLLVMERVGLPISDKQRGYFLKKG